MGAVGKREFEWEVVVDCVECFDWKGSPYTSIWLCESRSPTRLRIPFHGWFPTWFIPSTKGESVFLCSAKKKEKILCSSDPAALHCFIWLEWQGSRIGRCQFYHSLQHKRLQLLLGQTNGLYIVNFRDDLCLFGSKSAFFLPPLVAWWERSTSVPASNIPIYSVVVV